MIFNAKFSIHLEQVNSFVSQRIPSLLALIIMCVYAQGIFPNLTLELVNLVCLFGVSLKLVPGISEHVNAKKAESFALVLIVSIASLGLILEWKFPLTLGQLSVWVVFQFVERGM